MISVLGTGVMGKGIAIEFARFNWNVQLVTITRRTGINTIRLEIEKMIDKYKNINKYEILNNITISDDLSVVSNSDLIIEAIIEDLDAKRNLINNIKNYIKSEAIIASNTSSLSIKQIFEGIHDSSKALGLHFFNPVQVMKLVEIVYTSDTSEKTIKYAKEIVVSLGKEFVIAKDSPGFIVNRLLIPMINEASKIIDEGIATAEDIDKAMKLGANHPIGPLKLSDLIGNDVILSIIKTLHKNIKNKSISEGLVNLVNENKLGRKTKIGFYNYTE